MNEADNLTNSTFLAVNAVDSTNGRSVLPHAELVALTQELCSNNLLDQENQTEQALAECQKALQSHKKRLYIAEMMLTQQTQELAATQEQVRCLLHELEACYQTVQHQQILTETLTEQMQSSQERVAQMERECSLTQANYNERAYQLIQAENSCRELRSRLTRQQSHTLQLKLALEKCIGTPAPSYQSQADIDDFLSTTAKNEHSLQLESFFSKPQPIPPWSAQPQFLTNELEPVYYDPLPTPPTNWKESSASPLPAVKPDFAQYSTWECLAEDLSTSSQEEPEEKAAYIDLDQQPPAGISTEDSSEAEAAHLQNLFNLLEAVEESKSASPHIIQLPLPESPQPETSSPTPNSTWPSLVVYPSRPPKGRKTLAAIELPTFTAPSK